MDGGGGGGRISPSVLLSMPSPLVEKYALDGGAGDTVRFLRGRTVTIAIGGAGSATRRDRDSRRVHSRVLSDYKWEVRAYEGRLLALHDAFLAYMLFSKSGPAVRVVQLEPEARLGSRMLIQGFVAPTVDLAWATHASLLAVVDARCNLYVYHVALPLTVNKYVSILNAADGTNASVGGAAPRISWCPYIPEPGEGNAPEVNIIALVTGKCVKLFMLNVIRAAFGTDVRFEQLNTVKGACVQVELVADVTAVCLSPDATALAAAQSDGQVFFFELDGVDDTVDTIRFAHTWRPDTIHPVNHLIFLDQFNKSNEDQFWKYAVTSSHGGRHLNVWECETWQCLSRLRFETEDDDGTPLTLTIDPSNRFLFVSDIDRANVYCAELGTVAGGSRPRFVSCTQISLCQPLLHLVPLRVAEPVEALDVSIDEETNVASAIIASLIAINERSLLQLDIELDARLTPTMASIDDDDEDGERDVRDEEKDMHMTQQNDEFEMNERKSADSEEVRGILRKADEEALAQSIQQLNLKMDEMCNRSSRQYAEMEQRHSDEMLKMNNLCNDLAEQMRRRDESVLRAMRSEMTVLEEKLLACVATRIDDGVALVKETVVAATARSTDELEQRLSVLLRDALRSTVLPSLERVCESLFAQLNASFHRGLEQYMEQMRVMHAQATRAAAAVNEPRAIAQLIDDGKLAIAFDTALSRQDLSTLMLVCSKVDPDVLFDSHPCPLTQPVVLALIQQLATKLESQTELKFRYIEQALVSLNGHDPQIAAHMPVVMAQLRDAVNKFMAAEPNNSRFVRQCKTCLMLIKGFGMR